MAQAIASLGVVMADDNPAVEINGNRHLPCTTPEFVETFSQLPTRKDDVFVTSWPKSGKYYCNAYNYYRLPTDCSITRLALASILGPF